MLINTKLPYWVMLHAFYLLFFSSKYIQAEFQTVWILIMSHSHLHRITARASSLPSVCEIITSMDGKRAWTKMFSKIIRVEKTLASEDKILHFMAFDISSFILSRIRLAYLFVNFFPLLYLYKNKCNWE